MTDHADDATLGSARAWLRLQVDKGGAPCPCCTQFTKVYKRKLNSSMARALITMLRREPVGWFHAPPMLSALGGDWAKMAYWGLIEQSAEPSTTGGKTAGVWRMTDAGRRFARAESAVQKYARLYDGRCLGFDGPSIGVRDALGSKFDYDELMEGE